MPRFQITAVGVFGFKLYLNNMLCPTPTQMVFGPFENKDQLKACYDKELVEPYEEEGPDLQHSGQFRNYTKYFRKGGPFEWCVPLTDVSQWEKPNGDGAGVIELLLDIVDLKKEHEIT